MQGPQVDEWGNPVNPPGDPTASGGNDELNSARQFAEAWRAERGITSGSVDQYAQAYQQLRSQGFGYDDARQGAINVVGWGEGQQPSAPASPPQSQPSGPSQPSAPSSPYSQGPTLSQVSTPFQPPQAQPLPQVPQYNAPAYTPPPAFSFGDFQKPSDFQAPTAEQAANSPGWQFSQQQANKAFMMDRAASGVAATGGTVKDFLDYNKNMNAQQYSDEWNKEYAAYNSNFNNALNAYSTNRANAVGNYNTNYQTQYQDPWNIASQRAQQQFAPQLVGYQTNAANVQHTNDLANQNSWQDYLQRWNVFQGLFQDKFQLANA